MDLRKLKTLIDLVSDSNITELEITEDDGKVRIVKASAVTVAAPSVQMVHAAAPMAAPAAAPAVAAPVAAPAPAQPAGHVIKSPMVGTFYVSSTPGGKPMAEVGTVVKEGDAVCIIEAMKIMNEIESEFDGVVREVCVQDAHPVEYGQVLFRIDPNG